MRLGRFFSFDGRVGRLECWVTFGAAWLVIWGIGRLLSLFSPDPSDPSGPLPGYVGSMILVLSVFTAMLLTGIMLGATVKRWHDRDRSGLWTLLALIPIVGWAWVGITVAVLPGTVGPNRYGMPDDGSAIGDRS